MQAERNEHILMAHFSRPSFLGSLFDLPVRSFHLKITKMASATPGTSLYEGGSLYLGDAVSG